jgi:hypothetical protein
MTQRRKIGDRVRVEHVRIKWERFELEDHPGIWHIVDDLESRLQYRVRVKNIRGDELVLNWGTMVTIAVMLLEPTGRIGGAR